MAQMTPISQRPLVISAGEPAGIGPDICLLLAKQGFFSTLAQPCVIVADQNLLLQRAKQLGLNITLTEYSEHQTSDTPKQQNLMIKHVPLVAPCQAKQLNVANVAYVQKTLEIATQGCLNGQFQALVTGPVHKGIINESGFKFSGHTEWLAKKTATSAPVMMLASPQLRVALLTTHLPLAEVPKAITQQRLINCIKVIARDLQKYFNILEPRIIVCGLNPHAGENGYLGQEEQQIITPTIQLLQKQGYRLTGPIAADTAFTEQYLPDADVILAMYHDQGLPVLKYQGFHRAVNVTLGLPIIRTSVDHGTALDLAGSGQANPNSLQAAILLAITMVENQTVKTYEQTTH